MLSYEVEEGEYYFLGSIVLIKEESSPLAKVIDGQQRLTTLTILFAALADAVTDDPELKKELEGYVLEGGMRSQDIDPKPRLILRERDREFFKKYVQAFDFDGLAELDEATLENEARANIQRNAKHLRKGIANAFDTTEKLLGFTKFLLTRCYLVAVSTPNEDSAFRVFSVMNSRGLDLQPTDIIKADIIGKIDGEKDQQEYNKKWEEMEVALTREGFRDLFTYLRMIDAKEKAKRSLLEEFREHVLSKTPNPKHFIDDVLMPFAAALDDIRNANYYKAASDSETVNSYITWLNRIENSDWIPPAMLFLKKHRNKPALLADFFKRLERLAAYIHICRIYVNERIEIFGNLIAQIEEGKKLDDMEGLHLDEEKKKKFRNYLADKVYEFTPRRRNYLILRLDSFIGDGAASYDDKVLTIEHVLPQTVNSESEWANWWPDDDEREEWVHRLANLIPLNKRKNSAAQNYDFGKKRDAYFKGKNYVSSYALTSQVLSEQEWTPKTLQKRQKDLLDVLTEKWGLEAEG